MEDLELYDIDSGELSELIDNRKVSLSIKNEGYKKIKKQVYKIKEK